MVILVAAVSAAPAPAQALSPPAVMVCVGQPHPPVRDKLDAADALMIPPGFGRRRAGTVASLAADDNDYLAISSQIPPLPFAQQPDALLEPFFRHVPTNMTQLTLAWKGRNLAKGQEQMPTLVCLQNMKTRDLTFVAIGNVGSSEQWLAGSVANPEQYVDAAGRAIAVVEVANPVEQFASLTDVVNLSYSVPSSARPAH